MNEIASLPSLSDLVNQNPNLQPASLEDFANSEIGGALGGGLRSSEPSIATPTVATPKAPGVTGPSKDDRVTAPGFSEMFERFVKGVDHKKKVAKNEVQDLILGKSDNIHEAMIKAQEAGVAFNLMIQVRNKLVESYKELMRMRV